MYTLLVGWNVCVCVCVFVVCLMSSHSRKFIGGFDHALTNTLTPLNTPLVQYKHTWLRNVGEGEGEGEGGGGGREGGREGGRAKAKDLHLSGNASQQ